MVKTLLISATGTFITHVDIRPPDGPTIAAFLISAEEGGGTA
jgi:hypothetical protein